VTITALQAQAFAGRVEALAEDVGRLRRRLVDDEYGLHLVCRLAMHADFFDAFIRPTAAEIFVANLAFCGDEQQAVDAALGDVDARARHFRGLLGEGLR
jgi:hypothetical protein